MHFFSFEASGGLCGVCGSVCLFVSKLLKYFYSIYFEKQTKEI